VQRTCGPLSDGTQLTEVGIVLENLKSSPVQLTSFDLLVRSPDESELIPVQGFGSLDNNPDFNETDLGSAWGCDVASDEDASVFQALSSITCFNVGAPVSLPSSGSLTLATVRYQLGPIGEGQIAQLDLASGNVGGLNGDVVAECASCTKVSIELPADIPDTTPTPTPTTVPDQPPAQAVTSTDAIGTPENAYFTALDCDLLKAGIQDRCSFDVNASRIDVGFVVVSNVSACDFCDFAAFNFIVGDPDRSRLDPPPGSDLNLEGNPDFNDEGLTGGWQCVPPAPDNNRLPDTSPNAESFVSCFATSAPFASWLPGTQLLGATVHYAIPDDAEVGTVKLEVFGVSLGNSEGFELVDCFSTPNPIICRPATITLVDTNGAPAATNTPVPTATPTSSGGLIPISVEVTTTPTSGGGIIPLAACAEVTGDGIVTPEDAAVITSQVGKRTTRYDITHDGKVNVKDVLAAVRQLNRTC
jgi:hypothetical protein